MLSFLNFLIDRWDRYPIDYFDLSYLYKI